MHQNLQQLVNSIHRLALLSEADKIALIQTVNEVDKELEILSFKLDRTEKVKRTTAILLEETIEELEQKRLALEAQYRELGIESSLERVRTRAMGMRKPNDLPEICEVLFTELQALGFDELRNAMINIYPDEQLFLLNYDFAEATGKTVTKIPYNFHPLVEKQISVTKNTSDAFFEFSFAGDELKSFRELRKKNGEQDDPKLEITDALHYYFYSIGNGSIGISTYTAISDLKLELLKRFRNVFKLSYQRYTDVSLAEAQAREAQIEAALERVRSTSLAMHNSNELESVVIALCDKLVELGLLFDGAFIYVFEKEKKNIQIWVATKHLSTPVKVDLPFNEEFYQNAIIKDLWSAVEKGEHIFNKAYSGKTKDDYFLYAAKHNESSIPEAIRILQMEAKSWTASFVGEKNSIVGFDSWSGQITTSDDFKILKRFAKVFEQAYTRFLDLQKAEAQTREAQIETSLERVRSKTMAMHNSNDVGETVAAMFKEFTHLGIHTNRCGILIFGDENIAEVWTAKSTPEGNAKLIIGQLDLNAHQLLQSAYKSWSAKEVIHQYDLQNDDLRNYYEAINNSKFYPTQFDLNALPTREFHSDFYFTDGAVFSFTNEPVDEEFSKIMKRFAGVFGQTYRRYLDLQKAEAQARESQIQLALERVRARSMAMQHSGELREIAAEVHDQILGLGFTSGFCSIVIMDQLSGDMTWWMFFPGKEYPESYHLPYFEHPFYLAQLNNWKQGKKYSVIKVSGEEKKSYDKYVFSQSEFVKIPIASQQFMMSFEKITFSNAYMKHGAFSWGVDPIGEEHSEVLQRFASVFDQCYTRFLDLQKAEEQAREAKIEAALERVRSKTMAMQRSEDLKEVVKVLYEQLGMLEFQWGAAAIIIMDAASGDMDWWMEGFADGYELPDSYHVPYFDHRGHKQQLEYWKKGSAFAVIEISGQEKKLYDQYYFYQTPFNKAPENTKQLMMQQETVLFSMAYMRYGALCWSPTPITEEQSITLQRFAKVFEQTYTRFLDLQKAEAQAREAQIEVALERIRSRSLAMHHSDELKEVMSVMFKKLTDLEILIGTVGILLFDEKTKNCDFWLQNQHQAPGIARLPYDEKMMSGDNYMRDYWDAKTKGESFFNRKQTIEQKNRHFEYVFANNDIPQPVQDYLFQAQYHTQTFIVEKNSALLVDSWDERIYSIEQIEVLKRVAKVFEQAYIRFLDLQKAEAQAMEAIKRASVDRVRAEIASMRTTNDLSRITPLIWNELTTLGVPFIRCGVFIMDDKAQEVQTYLSTPDGKAIASFHVPYQTPGQTTEIIAHWQRKEMYTQHWDESAFIDYTNTLVQQGAISSGEKYLTENRPTDLHLHFLPFLQGMLYAGSETALTADELQLVQNLADAFATAYSRYEDFNKLEAAKVQIEKTLVDLKQAQSLIIQSEKMASLGELTAGIAHEIQNPLNFVNNFSELSNELIDEMNEELALGNVSLAGEIAVDIKKNLEKINHHGKRAESIVTGMLQHSRTSTGQKEPTDINKLADEYLRLAYHGLRAKDKDFNCEIVTDFDSSIGAINIVPQDIGRVILNLVNNAFYVVLEKQKAPPPSRSEFGTGYKEGIEKPQSEYKPVVNVTTRLLPPPLGLSAEQAGGRGACIITVADNGPGIPPKIIDKIFNPFFTTKPTGQGTGLGLSLSYDIVKAHAGEIKAETKEGEGSEFVIQLPVA